MDLARSGHDILSRALRTSWIVALALAASLAPASPRDAAAILAGQLIAALHFLFLRKIVKLFTERRGGAGLSLAIGAKTLLVYGGLFLLIRSGQVRYAPLCVGFALPFLVLFLKSMMLAFGAGPASLTRRLKKGALGTFGGAAAILLLLIPAKARAATALPSP